MMRAFAAHTEIPASVRAKFNSVKFRLHAMTNYNTQEMIKSAAVCFYYLALGCGAQFCAVLDWAGPTRHIQFAASKEV
jgi:hypothetical protein